MGGRLRDDAPPVAEPPREKVTVITVAGSTDPYVEATTRSVRRR